MTHTPESKGFQTLSLRSQITLVLWASLLLFTTVLAWPLWNIHQAQEQERITQAQSNHLRAWNALLDSQGDRMLSAQAAGPKRQQPEGSLTQLNTALLDELLRNKSQVSGLVQLRLTTQQSKVWFSTIQKKSHGDYVTASASLSSMSSVIRDAMGADFFMVDMQGQLLATNNQTYWSTLQAQANVSGQSANNAVAFMRQDWVSLPLASLEGPDVARLYVQHVKSAAEQQATSLWVLCCLLWVALVLVLGSMGQGLIERLFAPLERLGDDLTSLAEGDWFLDLNRPKSGNEIGRLQQALQVFQQQAMTLAKQGFEKQLSILRERALLDVELQRIAQLLPEQEQTALQAIMHTHDHVPHADSQDSQLARGFQMVSERVVDQQVRLNELLMQRTADLAVVQQALAERTHLDRLREELTLASKLQAANLPKPDAALGLRPTLDLFATMRPAREVGGDFYDFFQLDTHRLVLMVGDASGKGIAAGMLVLVARTLLRAHLLAGMSPAQSLQSCNRLLAQDNPGGSFTTVFLAVLDRHSGDMLYSNAGHNPPQLRRSGGTLESLEQASGVMLGIMDDWVFDTAQLQLMPGDSLLLYSDGVSEAQNTEQNLFGQTRLAHSFAQAHPDAQTAVTELLASVDAFAGEAEQFDDITVLILRFKPQNY